MELQRATSFLLLSTALATATATGQERRELARENEKLFQRLQEVHGLSEEELAAVRAIFTGSGFVGQGNPSITEHPLTPDACRQRLGAAGIDYADPAFEKVCQDKYMAPLSSSGSGGEPETTTCIDQFEFPNIPCEYPVVWVRASEAARLCEAVGKRLCDAHEWEGACAGRLEKPDYRFDLVVPDSPSASIRAMRLAHNAKAAGDKTWSYGSQYQTGICAASSRKTPECDGGSWTKCGSNTFPAGSFPECHSPLGVYDLNGNAAEHMNLPLSEAQMSSRGSRELGYTEMKGSWFIFDHTRAHEDWCRWRAPFWHGSRVTDPKSHHNYHLGFRCCKTVER